MSRRNESTGIATGIFLLLGLHFLAFWLWLGLLYLLVLISSYISLPFLTPLLANYNWIFLFLLPGLTQLVYVIPLVFWFRKRQNWGMMKGIITGAVFTALLNGGCFLVLFIQNS